VVEIIVAPIKPNSASVCEPGIARITAQGTGNGGASVFLQSTVRFRVYSNSCD
jgi:type IV pilus assembly protein PilX